jgi:hypothetical protein
MSNKLYDYGREGFLGGKIDWEKDDIRVALVTKGYKFNKGHRFLNKNSIVLNGESTELQSKATEKGVADAADIEITAEKEKECSAIVIYQNITKRLIAYLDDSFPIKVKELQVIRVEWNNGNNKIFKL